MAVILVIIAHQELIPLVGNGGPVGVSVFFTLSGFLITTLLLEERLLYGQIKVPGFYKRRFLRLVPAMVTCVALGSLVLFINGYVLPDWQLVVGTLTYTANWVMIGGTPHPTTLGHTWSLAIDEQFYLNLAARDHPHHSPVEATDDRRAWGGVRAGPRFAAGAV